MADVVIGLAADLDVETGIARHRELLAGAAILPVLALDAIAAGTGDGFHDFRHAGVEGQGRRQDHADALLRAIGENNAMTHAFSVEIDVGLLDHGDVLKLIFQVGHIRFPTFFG